MHRIMILICTGIILNPLLAIANDQINEINTVIKKQNAELNQRIDEAYSKLEKQVAATTQNANKQLNEVQEKLSTQLNVMDKTNTENIAKLQAQLDSITTQLNTESNKLQSGLIEKINAASTLSHQQIEKVQSNFLKQLNLLEKRINTLERTAK